MFDPLAEVFDHVLVLHPFDINILFREREGSSAIKHFSALGLGGPTSSTYIRADSINAVGYFGEGIVQS